MQQEKHTCQESLSALKSLRRELQELQSETTLDSADKEQRQLKTLELKVRDLEHKVAIDGEGKAIYICWLLETPHLDTSLSR
jgi:hypothetical protein